MGNPETLATLSTQDTRRRQTKRNKHSTTLNIKKVSNTDPTKKPGVNPIAREG